jgi:hypothetical protein
MMNETWSSYGKIWDYLWLEKGISQEKGLLPLFYDSKISFNPEFFCLLTYYIEKSSCYYYNIHGNRNWTTGKCDVMFPKNGMDAIATIVEANFEFSHSFIFFFKQLMISLV